jgi:Putative F0F1-ATPase subunit Ca2+/Mg2+ transporter
MKFFPKPPRDVRVRTDDSLGHGMDAVGVLVLFLGAGWGLDRMFGTMPVFMIVMTLLGSIGLFAKFKYSYERRMDELDGERIAKLQGCLPVTGAASTDEAA